MERANEGVEVYPEATKTGYSLDKWVDSEGNELSIHSIEEGKTFYASWIDDIAPVISISATSNISPNQTLSIGASDEGSGVDGYYIGLDNPDEVEVLYGTEMSTVVQTPGTYFCSARDKDGNVSTETITFDVFTLNANGGSVESESVLVRHNDTFVLPIATKYGYSGSWYEDGTDVPVTETVVNGNRAFTMQWTANNYIVTFDTNGGVFIADDGTTSTTSTKTVTYDDVYGNFPTPSKDGHTFLGWYTAASGGEQIVADNKVTTAENIMLYALFAKPSCTVTFNANGGSCSTTSCEVIGGNTIGTLPTPSRSGYSFVGWFTDTTGTAQVVTSTRVFDDITVYALWNGGTPATVWDGNVNNYAQIGYSVPETIYDWTVNNYAESDYSKYTYSTSYTYALPTKINQVTLTLPSQSTISNSFWPTTPILYWKKFYTATASVYVDGTLCGSIAVSHTGSLASYTCTFDQPVEGQVVKVVFSRNTYAFKGGQYFHAQELNMYGCAWWVWLSEVTIN